MMSQSYPRLYKAYLAPAVAGGSPPRWELTHERFEGLLDDVTFGDLGIAGRVSSPASFGVESEEPVPNLLCLPFADKEMAGIDASTVRMFCAADSKRLTPVWDSGVNAEMGVVWARVCRPGTYIPIGLPRDRLLRQLFRETARARRLAGDDGAHEAWTAARLVFRVLTEPPLEVVEELREFLTRVEVQTGTGLEQLKPHEIRFRQGLRLAPFPLPKGHALESVRSRLSRMASEKTQTFTSLLEEELFYPPDPLPDVPWHRPGVQRPFGGIDLRQVERLRIWDYFDLSIILPYLFSQDWWMYQHDLRHTGAASGYSGIRSTTVNRLALNSKVGVEGPIVTKPVIVDGKIYVGSGKIGDYKGGILFRIDLATGKVEGRFQTCGIVAFATMRGIGGSPAVVGGRVYFTGIHGKVYCLDAATMTDKEPYTPALWVTDLKSPSEAQNQPINQLAGDSWSSPLVVNGKVYVGCGNGEEAGTYGFVFCLDADTGRVLWLFCTCKFSKACDNSPNVIPASVAVSNPLPAWAQAAGFQLHDDSQPGTLEAGCSVWSSCAYDRVLNRIYVGTGNSQIKDTGTDLPDELYGSGLLSLDADTGKFCKFFQPLRCDSYLPTDEDVDVAGSPTIFFRNGEWVVAFGSKNGSFFLLEPDTLDVIQRRQLLPRKGGSGLPDDPGAPIHSVVPVPTFPDNYENHWGVFATPAVHAGTGKLFVCLGRDEIADPDKTPFVRALDWTTLKDAWPTAEGADKVTRYTNAKPPLYTTSETGLSSPAVVNDVVFISTKATALYAMDVHKGLCLWSAQGLPKEKYALGPAIYGDYVVLGADEHVYIYVLPR